MARMPLIRALETAAGRLRRAPGRVRREVDDAVFSITHVRRWPCRQAFLDDEPRLRELLTPAYRAYVADVSDQSMAISLDLACVLYFLCERLEPRVILDLGSGFSSYVFRRYTQARPGTVVYSVDDDPYWLSRTRVHLKQHGLCDRNLFLWDEVSKLNALRADVVLHDIGSSETRCEVLPELSRYMHRATAVVLDDVHKRPVREAAKAFARSMALPVTDLARVARDSFGRFPWLIGHAPMFRDAR